MTPRCQDQKGVPQEQRGAAVTFVAFKVSFYTIIGRKQSKEKKPKKVTFSFTYRPKSKKKHFFTKRN